MKHLPLLLLLGGLLSASAARSADPVRYVDAATLTVIGKALSTEQPYNRIDTTRFRVPAKTPGYCYHPTGLAVVFRTDSRTIRARWETSGKNPSDNMAAVAQKGLDLYIRSNGEWVFAGVGRPKINGKNDRHDAAIISNMAEGEKECLLYLPLYDQLKKLDYVRKSEWNYADHGLDVRKLEPVTLDMPEGETNALLRIAPVDGRGARVQMRDPADTDEVLAESLLYPRDFFDAAKRLYINKDDLAAYKAEVKGKRDQERARQEEAEKWQALARQELEAFDNWPLVTRLKDLGLTIRERKMADGGRLIIAVDDLTRFSGHVDGFQYRECFAVRLGPNGERAGRDGDINALEWYKRWYSTGAGIENYIAEDIERSEKQ